MPGSCDAKAQTQKADTIAEQDKLDVAELNTAIETWREAEMIHIKPLQVIPDFTNRAQTGISVEHAHFVATSMMDDGFQERVGSEGHDVPVVIRETGETEQSKDSLRLWKGRIAKEPGFPPCSVMEGYPFFSSLGNGHFFQALILIATGRPRLNDAGSDGPYSAAADKKLRSAIENGVPSIVLKKDTPRKVRARISELLNSKHEFRWILDSSGDFRVENKAESKYISQFERITKHLDAQELNCLVRFKTGVTDSD